MVERKTDRLRRLLDERGDMRPLKLLPCPYCKAKPHYHINPDNDYQYANFHHEDECFFTSLGLQYDNIGELMAPAWNRRAQ